MPKTLVPVIASLALCGSAAVAVIATTAHAQPEPKKPMLVAANTPTPENRPAGTFRRAMPAPGEMAAHLKQMCEDGYAREAGALAYLDAKLELTGAQKPAFERWKQARLDIAKRRADTCATMDRPRAAERPGVVELMAMREDMLKRQLADITAERPALEAFYKTLGPEQQRDFTRAAEHHLMERGRMLAHRMMGPGPGPMDRMMHRGAMPMPPPPEGPAMAPPASPPQ